MNSPYTVIVGGGLSALMMARMIKLYRDPDANIVIVEKEETIGGQYGSYDYKEFGCFDIGMHIYYESCVPEIDKIFTELLPAGEWNILEHNYKDIQGLFYNGRLQTDTPSIDLRNLPGQEWGKYISDIFQTIKRNHNKELPDNRSAYDVLLHHFGKVTTDEIFVPVLDKLYQTHPDKLDELATLFTPLTRVALFDSEPMLDLMKSDQIRARIAYPDQLTLPPYRTNLYRGFYPKKFGMFRVLEKLRSVLELQGVRVITSAAISQLEISGMRTTSVTVKNKDLTEEIFSVNEVFWAAGLPPLAHLLKIDFSDLVNDKKQTESMYINLLFDKLPEMGKLYYFFCFDKGYRTFRVTNYTNYCPDAPANRGYPVCIEWWALPGDSKEEKEIISLAVTELKSFGVINDTYSLLFSKVEKLKGFGFPLPSLNNIRNMKTIGDRIKKLEISNIIPTGVLSGKNVFFIKDVLIDTYKKVLRKHNADC